MREVKVRPAKGTVIKDDHGREIPPTGKKVQKSIRIARAIREGSLIVVDEEPKATPKTTTGKGDK